jgi:hypothetical protein
MTTQQRITIQHIEQQHEAQRFAAEQAAREVAQLDAVSVLYAVEVKIAEGRIDEAKAMVEAYRKSQKGS